MRLHFVGLLMLAAAIPSAAMAQHTTGAAGRVAGIAPSVPAAPAAGSYRSNNVPVYVAPDGKVYANFGRGYEHLVRNCSVPYANFNQPVTTQPSVSQPTPYMPPIPNAQGPTQKAAAEAAQPGNAGNPVNSRECWSTDARGQPLIGR